MTITLSVIIAWLITGLVVGGLAHLLVPGRNRVGFLRTVLFGIAGALIGGIITAAILGGGHVIVTFIVALIVSALLISADTHRAYLRGRYSRRRRYSGRYSRRGWRGWASR
jgi:uncharacterized membrane protein YeaQ/YmgE (transglycosylase-associated protein family)